MLNIDYVWDKERGCWQVTAVSADVVGGCDGKKMRKLQAKAVKRVLKLAACYNSFTRINAELNKELQWLEEKDHENSDKVARLREQLEISRLSWFIAYIPNGGQIDLLSSSGEVLETDYEWLSTGLSGLFSMSHMERSTIAAKWFYDRGWGVAKAYDGTMSPMKRDDGIPF